MDKNSTVREATRYKNKMKRAEKIGGPSNQDEEAAQLRARIRELEKKLIILGNVALDTSNLCKTKS